MSPRPPRYRPSASPTPAPAPESPYSPQEQRRILSLAREAVVTALFGRGLKEPNVAALPEPLTEMRGCFVTVRNGAKLRGCLGTFEADAPLWKNIQKMGGAATRDPRFVKTDPLQPAELDDLRIEVSVLTPMRRIGDPTRLRLGIDGIYIKAKSGSGCFLPQVAGEQGWSVEQLLGACCDHKMGLAADAWRDPVGLSFFTFQACVIEEPEA